jgi:hypothetical protein
MRKRLAVALAIVGTLAVAGIAIAGSLPGSGTGSISLAGADGSKIGSAGVTPHYQGTVWFSYSGTDRLKNPRAYVRCYQPDASGNLQLVYGEAGHAYDTFTLGGGYSQWVANGGGPASCWADLYYFKVAGTNREWSGHGEQQEYVWLATTPEFDAAG